MPYNADRPLVSVIVRSSLPAGKAELIQALHSFLKMRFPELSIKVPTAYEDAAPFKPNGRIELVEAIDAPGLGSLTATPGMQVAPDQVAKQKIEISQMIGLFLSQVNSEHFENAKVEYPTGNQLVTIETLKDTALPAPVYYRVRVRATKCIEWVCNDVDQAMDMFRHYATDGAHAPSNWVWVKTMDLPRSSPNLIRYITERGSVEFAQHPSGMADGDFFYTVQLNTGDASNTGNAPTTAGSFITAVDYFFACAANL